MTRLGEVNVERDVGPYATELINYHPDKCVMCLRCVHACKEVKLVGPFPSDFAAAWLT